MSLYLWNVLGKRVCLLKTLLRKKKEKEDCWKLIKEQIGGMVIDSIDVVKVFYRKYMLIPKILKE